MPVFRDQTPIRRPNRRKCKHYTSYRKTLREDFNFRCGYCDDLDKHRFRSFAIDHFVPQNPNGFSHNLAPNYYYNLVYSCNYCNGSKSNNWPTNDLSIHNDGVVGFIDPIEQEYTDIFERTSDGRIVPSNPDDKLAKHIIDELGLWLPIHALMWKFEKLRGLKFELKQKLKSTSDANTKEMLRNVHYEILVELDEVLDNILVENE